MLLNMVEAESLIVRLGGSGDLMTSDVVERLVGSGFSVFPRSLHLPTDRRQFKGCGLVILALAALLHHGRLATQKRLSRFEIFHFLG